ICTPRKMIRSSNILLYGFISLTPYEVRSTNDGRTYRLCTGGTPLVRRSAAFTNWSRTLVSSSTLASPSAARPGAGRYLVGGVDHPVDEAVVLGFLCREPTVAVGVDLDLFHALAGVERDPLLDGAL